MFAFVRVPVYILLPVMFKITDFSSIGLCRVPGGKNPVLFSMGKHRAADWIKKKKKKETAVRRHLVS